MEKFTHRTPDPLHTPGFMGFCPQLVYKCGRSYAQLTSEILSRSHVNQSRGQAPTVQPDTALHLRTISGFTGFVPKIHFGATNTEKCREVTSELNQERRATVHQPSAALPAAASSLNQQPERPKPPLKFISDKVFIYKPVKPFVPLGTPYMMDDDDPHKHFIPGFSGHVPKSRFLCGKSFSKMTNQALIQFGQQQQQAEHRKDGPGTSTSSFRHEGVVPFFTGHIPGYRYMHGQTFGQLSKAALEQSRRRINEGEPGKQK